MVNDASATPPANARPVELSREPVRFRGVLGGVAFGGDLLGADLSAELPEQRRRHDLVEQRRAEQPANHDDRQRMQNLFAGLPGPQGQRDQTDRRGQRRHQHRCEALQTAADDRVGPKQFSGNRRLCLGRESRQPRAERDLSGCEV